MIEQRAEIIFNQPLTDNTWFMGLKSREIAGAAGPGQFVMVRVGDGLDPLLRRPFSICGTRDDAFLILYRVVGKGTNRMTGLIKGSKVSVLGPLGRGFDLPGKVTAPVLLGGGIGVAPLFFLSQVLERRDCRFLMGFATASEVITPEHIGLPPFGLSIATDDGSRGYAGLVTDLLRGHLEESQSRAESLSVLTCGPTPMLKAVAAMTMAHGICCQVSVEANMACGLGACQGCAIPAARDRERAYFHVCQDGPVFPAEAIDWSKV